MRIHSNVSVARGRTGQGAGANRVVCVCPEYICLLNCICCDPGERRPPTRYNTHTQLNTTQCQHGLTRLTLTKIFNAPFSVPVSYRLFGSVAWE